MGGFQLFEPLAEGGMGVVWTANRSGELGPPMVAVKLMRADRASDPRQREIFEREAALTLRLSHPNVVRGLSSGTLPAGAWPEPLAPGCPWLAMQRAAGGTLIDRVGRMPWTAARQVLLEILDALAYIHDIDVVHLDIKPGNVLIGSKGETLLADFGLARSPESLGQTAAFEWGTAAYMAPEQLSEDSARIGPATDLYALGCVAWALLSGRPPFGRAPEEAAVQHLCSPVPNLVSELPIPQGTECWLRRLLMKDPAQRYPDAHSAAVALLALGEAPVAEGGTAARRVVHEPTTRPLLSAQRLARPLSEPRKRSVT